MVPGTLQETVTACSITMYCPNSNLSLEENGELDIKMTANDPRQHPARC